MAAFERSGLGLTAFCRRIGVSPQRMYYWRDRLRAAETESGALLPQFVEVAVRQAHPGPAAVVELGFPSGHVLRVPASIGLDQVLRAAGLVAC